MPEHHNTAAWPRSKHDDFLHHHCVSFPTIFFMATLSVAAAVLRYLSPAVTPLPLVWTLSHSASSSTVSVGPHDDGMVAECPESVQWTHYLHNRTCSNQRTRNQFRPRNATKGSTSYQLRQYAEATLGGGSLRKIVKLPEGEDENEWLAVNSAGPLTTVGCPGTKGDSVVDFYNHINLLYGSITEFCSPQSCPEMKATDECVLTPIEWNISLHCVADSSTSGKIPKPTNDPLKCPLQLTLNT